tara:strand:+ start:2783 stop:3091 length:309 start_codon:yes stop_codon:yes gene_type:complete
MNTKFTPGPWGQSHRKDKSGGYSTEVYDSNGETICTLDCYVVPTEKGFTTNRDENARLIACAPDMYEMLDTLTDSSNTEDMLAVLIESKSEISELLKRARGE